MYKFFKPFELPKLPEIPDNETNILDFGADNSGKKICTEEIENAISELSKLGGGKLVFPKGTYLTGPVVFKSNIEIHLEKDAVILFSGDFNDYMPPKYMQRGGVRCFATSPLIYSYQEKNIALTGDGTVDGNGAFWWDMQKNQPGMNMLTEFCANQTPLNERILDKKELGVRPPFIHFIESENILISGIKIINSPSWTVHPFLCKNLTVENVAINSPVEAKNSDGIDPDCCENVYVNNCNIHTGDDAFALKALRNQEGWIVNTPTKNVLVENCSVTMSRGGLSVGSEMSGGVSNVLFRNCTLDGTNGGIRLKANAVRGGYIKDIEFHNITLKKINQQAIQLTLRYGDCYPRDDEEKISRLENVYIENVTCKEAPVGIEILGLEKQHIKNIVLKNIEIKKADVLKNIDCVDNLSYN